MTITNPGQVEKEIRIGGGGGGVFDLVPTDPSITITGRCGSWINQISLNGETFGDGGGGPKDESLVVAKTDYINYANILYGDFVNTIIFKTKNGVSWQMGESYTDKANTELKDIRVVGIGGSSGKYLDAITIRYLDNYDVDDDSEDDPGKNIFAILRVYGPGTTIENTQSIKARELEAITLINEFTIDVESEITASYMVAEATSRFGFSYMNRQELAKELETETVKSTKETFVIEDGFLGIESCNVMIKKRKSGSSFLVPTNGRTIMPMTVEAIKKLNFFDLSGNLHLQIPDIAFTSLAGWKNYHAAEQGTS